MAGSVRKRAWTTREGAIKTAWLADYYDQHGKRQRRTFASKGAADHWLDTTRIEVKAGIHTPDAKSISVKAATRVWLGSCAINGRERGTLRVYERYVRIYIDPALGPVKLSRLTTAMVDAFCEKLLGQTSRQRTRKVLSALRLTLNTMQRKGLVGQNVASAVKVEQDGKRQQKKLEVGIDVPAPGEVHAILQAAEGRDRVRLILAALTGMRASGIRGLAWPDVDFAGNRLRIRQRADWWGSLGDPKSEKGRRTIPMIPLVANALKEWRLASPPCGDDAARELVFYGRHRGVMSYTSVQEGLDRVQRAAGITRAKRGIGEAELDRDGNPKAKYSPDKLRHFFASWIIDQGAGKKELQELMGHDQSTRTEDLYEHWFRDDEKLQARMTAAEAAFFARHR
jgi:integrase